MKNRKRIKNTENNCTKERPLWTIESRYTKNERLKILISWKKIKNKLWYSELDIIDINIFIKQGLWMELGKE